MTLNILGVIFFITLFIRYTVQHYIVFISLIFIEILYIILLYLNFIIYKDKIYFLFKRYIFSFAFIDKLP